MGELETALTATGLKFAHFGWSKAPKGDYGVFAEDGANDLVAGNVHAERVIEGTVDYFTRDANMAAKALIEAALNSCAAWRLESIQFESDTGYIHLEWVFQVMG